MLPLTSFSPWVPTQASRQLQQQQQMQSQMQHEQQYAQQPFVQPAAAAPPPLGAQPPAPPMAMDFR
jgi:hypothetical protein